MAGFGGRGPGAEFCVGNTVPGELSGSQGISGVVDADLGGGMGPRGPQYFSDPWADNGPFKGPTDHHS